MGTNIKNSSNMCFGCRINCCKTAVTINSYDIARIAIQEKKIVDDFVVVAKAKADELMAFKARGGLMRLELNRNKKGCIFSCPNKKLRCSVENSKPAVCLAYPFAVWDDTQVLCSRILCPPKNLQDLDQAKMNKKVLKQCRREWEQYSQMVVDWNSFAQGDEPPEDFLRFSLKETALESIPLGSLYRKIKRPFLRFIH